MAASDVPAEAVEAAAVALRADDNKYDELDGGWERLTEGYREHYRRSAAKILAAAAPHIRAQVLAEVDAALRDLARFDTWIMQSNRWDDSTPIGTTADFEAADYVRDTLGAGGEG